MIYDSIGQLVGPVWGHERDGTSSSCSSSKRFAMTAALQRRRTEESDSVVRARGWRCGIRTHGSEVGKELRRSGEREREER
eukprot:1164241-Rhodomonas_salina.2